MARENGGVRVAIGFSFVSDWLDIWCEFSRPIRKHLAKLLDAILHYKLTAIS